MTTKTNINQLQQNEQFSYIYVMDDMQKLKVKMNNISLNRNGFIVWVFNGMSMQKSQFVLTTGGGKLP